MKIDHSNSMNIDVEGVRNLCIKILAGAGVPEPDAMAVADNLVQADLRGIGSHGISRMFAYCQRIQDHMINLDPDIRVIKETGSTLLVDGDNGLGAVVGIKTMDLCMKKAKESGMASCAVRNGNHFGFAAYYAMRALPQDMIGMAFTNAPPTMAPWGSITPLLGTNPFCYAIPAGRYRPIVLDSATSVVARGKISLAEIENRPIPESWAMDDQGRPTTNATEALKGTVLPFGSYKGSGISMMIDIFCALLGGAQFGGHIGNLYNNSETHQELGFFFSVIDIKSFSDPGIFKARIDQMIDEIKNSEKAYGVDEIFVPGEIEFNNEAENLIKGIEIGPGVLKDLNTLRIRYGIDVNPSDYIKKQ